MPARIEPQHVDQVAVRQIVSSGTDADFLDQLVEGMRNVPYSSLQRALDDVSRDRDVDIEHVCTSNHQAFIDSVTKLNRGREDCSTLGKEILGLVQSYQSSSDNFADQKKNLVDSKSQRQNIDESSEALKECLEVLRLSNQVHDLVSKQNHYAALRALDELQALLRVRESSRYKIGDLIEKSIPATQKMIAEAVMNDLNTWLYRIRDVSQYIGEVAFFHTEQRRARQKERAAQDPNLGTFKLNSPIELVADEMEEYDVLNDEEAQVQVDFTPLFEALHIHEALGQSDRFRSEYGVTRRRQKDLILPVTLRINDDEASDLKTLLESIAGFSIVERATMKRTENLRTSADVDELWDSMSQSAISLMSAAVQSVESPQMLLKIIGVISLFTQTMETWQFYSGGMNTFLIALFEKYVQLLKTRTAEDFQEIVSTDDYMPMPINDMEQYEKIIDVGWYEPEKEHEDIGFPTVLPFSQMYPMCCIDIRNFLNQVYSAPDDYVIKSSQVDDTIKASLDELLSVQICQPLLERLNSQYPGQIVQIWTNMEHFEKACQDLQGELARAKTSRSRVGPIILSATQAFRAGRQKAKRRVFELVNSKIADLIKIAEYDWDSTVPPQEPSDYMNELTRWLSNVMNSVLLGLPVEVKDMIYLDALTHAASGILELPLDPSVTSISPSCVRLMELDVSHLSGFFSNLSLTESTSQTSEHMDGATADPSVLRKTMDELTQTVRLMANDNTDEFFDISQRNKKFGAVNPERAVLLLEKVDKGKRKTGQGPEGVDQNRSKAAAGFGSVMRNLRGA